MAVIIEVVFFYAVVRKWQPLYRKIYIGLISLIYLCALAPFTVGRTLILQSDWMAASTWGMFALLINFIPKLVYTFFFAIGFICRKFLKKLSLKPFKITGVLAALFTICTLCYGAIWGVNELRTERVEIQNKKIPESFDGYKIALFSDMHIGNLGSNNDIFEDLVEAINNEKPDIVVQCGDLVNLHSGELTEDIMAKLSKIEAPVYSVIGNHDLGYYIYDTVAVNPTLSRKELIEKQRKMGWKVMDNKSEWVHRGGDSILIGGTTFPSNHHHNGYRSDAGKSDLRAVMAVASRDDFSVIASHSPALFDSIYKDSVRPDLILSGHVHSMQSKIEVGGWKWSPARFLYPNFSGLYTDRGHQLYINDGIGYVIMPIRIGARPELTIFTLKPIKNNEE